MINLSFSYVKSLLIAALGFVLLGCSAYPAASISSPQAAEASHQIEQTQISVLVFSKTEGFRHNSIEPAIQLLQTTAAERGWTLTATEDVTLFTEANLATFDVVVFLLTSGDVLNSEQERAFEQFIQAGGGYAGIHSASDTEYDWPWYGGLVGAYFNGHPAIQIAELNPSNESHASTSFLPSPWTLNDEWYNFKTNPATNNNIKVLLWLDESTYSGGNMGAEHPITWSQFYDGGRAWYTGIGHRSEHYTGAEGTLFQQHIIAGIEWAADRSNVPVDLSELNKKNYLPIMVTSR